MKKILGIMIVRKRVVIVILKMITKYVLIADDTAYTNKRNDLILRNNCVGNHNNTKDSVRLCKTKYNSIGVDWNVRNSADSMEFLAWSSLEYMEFLWTPWNSCGLHGIPVD